MQQPATGDRRVLKGPDMAANSMKSARNGRSAGVGPISAGNLAGRGPADSCKDLSHFPNQLRKVSARSSQPAGSQWKFALRASTLGQNRLKFPTRPPFGEENS